MKDFILNHIEWIATSLGAIVLWAFKMEYNTRQNKDQIKALEEDMKEIREHHKLMEKMAKKIDVINTNIEWMKKQIERNSKK